MRKNSLIIPNSLVRATALDGLNRLRGSVKARAETDAEHWRESNGEFKLSAKVVT